jgi:hypothetical protein
MDKPSEQTITIDSKLPNEKLKGSELTGQELDATPPPATSPERRRCRVSPAPSSMPAPGRCWSRTGRSTPTR